MPVGGHRLEPDRHFAGAGDKVPHVVSARGDAVLALGWRRLRQKLLHQRRELEAREDVVQLCAIRFLPLQLLEVDVVDRQVALDAGEVARHEGLVAIFLELLPLRRFQLVEVFVDAFQRPELRDQRFRAFLTDTRNARDVVDGITPDSHDVDHLLGRQSERLRDTIRVVEHLAPGVKQLDAVADELKEILIGGGQNDVVAALACNACQSTEQIVRFPVLDTDHRNAKAFEHLVDERQLDGKVVGHRPAILLVVGKGLVPRLRAADVEGHGDAIGLEVLQQFLQRLREAVDGVRGQARGVRQIADREVRAIDIVGAVDEEKGGTFRHGRGGL